MSLGYLWRELFSQLSCYNVPMLIKKGHEKQTNSNRLSPGSLALLPLVKVARTLKNCKRHWMTSLLSSHEAALFLGSRGSDSWSELHASLHIHIWIRNSMYMGKTVWECGLRPSPFFSLFSVVRPTQIFAFSKKKNVTLKAMTFYSNLKHKQFFALQIFSFFPDLVWF